MAIDVLAICEWIDRSVNHMEIKNPSWFDVEQAICSLNNGERNDLYLIPDENDPGTYLGIGGGDGVTGSARNKKFPTIVDPEIAPTPKELLLVGGQEGDYPGNWLIDLDDGWLFTLRFEAQMRGVTPLLRTSSPKAKAASDATEPIVSWAYERSACVGLDDDRF